MSEALLTNPAMLGPRDPDGAAYVFAVTADDGLPYDACHGCALTAFALGQPVECAGTLAFEDVTDPTHCNFCCQPIDNSLRVSLDDCAWIDALQDALEAMARDPQAALAS